MKFWTMFCVDLGLLCILIGAFHPHAFSNQWWLFVVGSSLIGSAVAQIVGEKKK